MSKNLQLKMNEQQERVEKGSKKSTKFFKSNRTS